MNPRTSFWSTLVRILSGGLGLLLVSVLLVACDVTATEPAPTLLPLAVPPSPLAQEATAMPTEASAATETATAFPTLEATATAPMPEPTATPLEAVLPESLYFISSEGQIMRLEADGQSLSAITEEAEPVTDYDVADGGQKIAFVSGNNLYEAAADGSARQLKVAVGAFVDDGSGSGFITMTISQPRYSPDGSQITFGLNGVNLIASGTATEYQNILPSDPFPDFSDPASERPEGPVRFFWPKDWSPDGSKILTQLAYFPEGGGLVVLNVADGNLIEIFNDDYINCCDWTWSPNSLGGFIASDQMAYGTAGIAQVDALSGGSNTLILGQAPDGAPPPEGSVTLFRAPLDLGDGTLQFFIAAFDFESGVPPYTLASYDPQADQITPLNEERYSTSQMRWFGDGRGAAIVVVDLQAPAERKGQLHYLSSDGQPALPLPAEGSSPIWANGD